VETEPSLRERKKQETHVRLFVTAVALFAERGFENVSVAEIADASGVSKVTLFNYFPTKEDLVLAPMEEHRDDMARAVRERATGESAVEAIRRDFIARIESDDPSTGVSDVPAVMQTRTIIMASRSLQERVVMFTMRAEELLADVLAEEAGDDTIVARVAAGQIARTRHLLVVDNVTRLVGGESIDVVRPRAVDNAERAFRVLEVGLGSYCR
jgi:AcrR family transcriptional regulator